MSANAFDPTAHFGHGAPLLIARGWRRVIPLHPSTKIPAMRAWTEIVIDGWSEEALEATRRKKQWAAIGLVMGSGWFAIDIDRPEADLAEELVRAADRIMGHTPLRRIGGKPGGVLLYSANRDDDIRTRRPGGGIELLAGGSQFAAYGWHAKAGRHYFWPEGSLYDIDAGSPDIPTAGLAEIKAFFRDADRILGPVRQREWKALGRRERPPSLAGSMDIYVRAKELVEEHGWREAVEMIDDVVDPGDRHHAVFSMAALSRHAGIEPDEANDLLLRLIGAILAHDPHADSFLDRALSAIWAPRPFITPAAAATLRAMGVKCPDPNLVTAPQQEGEA